MNFLVGVVLLVGIGLVCESREFTNSSVKAKGRGIFGGNCGTDKECTNIKDCANCPTGHYCLSYAFEVFPIGDPLCVVGTPFDSKKQCFENAKDCEDSCKGLLSLCDIITSGTCCRNGPSCVPDNNGKCCVGGVSPDKDGICCPGGAPPDRDGKCCCAGVVPNKEGECCTGDVRDEKGYCCKTVGRFNGGLCCKCGYSPTASGICCADGQNPDETGGDCCPNQYTDLNGNCCDTANWVGYCCPGGLNPDENRKCCAGSKQPVNGKCPDGIIN